jgi:hypothetical protein
MATSIKPVELRRKAESYRALASTISDPQTIDALYTLAVEFEAQADKLEKNSKLEEP